MNFENFRTAITFTREHMRSNGQKVHRGTWQGVDVSKRPDFTAYELLHYHLRVPMRVTSLAVHRTEIQPNLPWADDHFMERISGNPLNPGKEWENWPWGASADKFRISPFPFHDPGPERIFDHTYAQRYYPKWAGRFSGGIIPQDNPFPPHHGIYFDYGDLDDVILELVKEPTTRQAILPIFHPEDTGWRANRRKPCSISYHFMLNFNQPQGLDIFYHLRSCDLIRHFRDDIYLTVRLALWVLDRLRQIDQWWNNVAPGDFVMYIGNLHCFANDMRNL